MKKALERLYEARFVALQAEAEVLDGDDEARLASGLAAAVEAAGRLSQHERSFRLQVLASLLAKVRHPDAVQSLLQVLNDSDPSVRARAAVECATVASSRYPELVAAAEHAVEGGMTGPALLALPGLLVGTYEPGDAAPAEVLVRLLDDDDPDVTAEAACGLAELGLPGVVEFLSSFEQDERRLSDAVDGPATVGEMVRQLLDTMELEREI